MRTKTQRLTAWLLTAIMAFTTMAGAMTPALAAESTSKLNTVTEKYIDESDGSEIIDSKVSSVSYDEKNPQTIEGYTYAAYTEETAYVNSEYNFRYIYGYPDGSVQGEGNMTRAEAAAVFYRLYQGDYPKYTNKISSGTFSDVSADAWYWEELATCYSLGLIVGYGDGTFRPDAPISRAEFAVLAARWAELGYLDIPTFSDVQKGYWAYGYISAAVDAGWVVGYGDGTFRPDEYITRAEVVTLVNKMFDRQMTAESLRELGVSCPYNDLADTYWGYGNLMEASVPHTHYEWHGTEYNRAFCGRKGQQDCRGYRFPGQGAVLCQGN